MFGKTFTNKLISYADRYYTYDRKEMRRENTSTLFDFYAHNDDDKTTVLIDRTEYGIYVCIRKGKEQVICRILHTYKEIADFKRMIRCLG